MNLLHCLPMDIQNQNVSKPTGQLCYQSSLRNTSLSERVLSSVRSWWMRKTLSGWRRFRFLRGREQRDLDTRPNGKRRRQERCRQEFSWDLNHFDGLDDKFFRYYLQYSAKRRRICCVNLPWRTEGARMCDLVFIFSLSTVNFLEIT